MKNHFLYSLCLAIQFLPADAAFADESIRLAPGDDKTNYVSKEYRTNSLSIERRKGITADLLEILRTPQLGLPEQKASNNNPPDKAKIALGKKLFFDRRLSRNRTMSCAMCHIPEQGFTNNELSRPIGFEGRGLKRNAPTILNVAFYERLFVDLREFELEQQVWSPLLASNEMNNPSIGFVLETIRHSDDYDGLFEQAFSSQVSMQSVGKALAQYQRAMVSGNSKFDRWKYGADEQALTDKEVRGYRLFVGKARCASCHLIGESFALFTDQKAHNTGIGYQDSMHRPDQLISVQLAPGVTAKISQSKLDSVGTLKPNDLGLYEVTLEPNDRWKFRTPSLRNIQLTAPYMHNGELLSLKEVIEFYNRGGIKNELLSPLIRPLGLSKQEQLELLAFLQALTGSNVRTLVSDAFTAPIGDPSN